jgi:hypothetical protein
VIVRAQLTFAVVALFLIGAAASGAADGPSLSVNDPLVTESDSGSRNAVFTVRLSAPAAGPVSVDYVTADDSANAPDDYEAAAGTVTFAPGETVRQVAVAVAGDTLDEPHESFVLNMSNPSGAVLDDARGIGTILDNDPLVSLSIDDVSAPETSGSADFAVSLSGASGKVVTVAYASADGSAGAPGDYAARAGTLIFMPGQTTKTVAVPLQDDDLVEADETFTATLSAPSARCSQTLREWGRSRATTPRRRGKSRRHLQAKSLHRPRRARTNRPRRVRTRRPRLRPTRPPTAHRLRRARPGSGPRTTSSVSFTSTARVTPTAMRSSTRSRASRRTSLSAGVRTRSTESVGCGFVRNGSARATAASTGSPTPRGTTTGTRAAASSS